MSETQIASGYLIRVDPNAFVVGPTDLAYDADKDVLYVASTGDNAIFAIPSARKRATDAGMGDLICNDNAHLHCPLGLALAPNEDFSRPIISGKPAAKGVQIIPDLGAVAPAAS